ncbi:NODULIN- 26-LIKE MAJOR INTRINSIC PROTEIN 5, NOD26-like intrinsic protein 4;2 [Hibiscus trionum]|uniref:NODULIN- 26-LIKE MAJOR INTRINSIC PROTEIN 5, NOD26-like intrinsic protein 42 n=1 Tax=Hibiscus trionum TaxID=183268 RepID=A0A9W7JF05_HIBTR|nr:NODULIN- 26-LIKE MAJOR INTRINSIC PROTEIN 5, NOD26-like intrinsic protein 4;2 [Hibiscus trionum]
MSSIEKSDVEEGRSSNAVTHLCYSPEAVTLLQKVIAEIVGTYFLIFAGCGSVVVNKLYGGTITFPGICIVWGLIVMVMIYSVGHISGAHFNPAVTITFAIFRRFPLKQVPLYLVAQLLGSILASETLNLIWDIPPKAFFGTVPLGSAYRSFILEIIISFLLMFVVSGVATDSRAIGELAGIAVGMTVMLNVFIVGPVSGASMNPARTLGPAIVMRVYDGIWVYMAGPIIGTIMGGFVYNLIRFTDKPLHELTKPASFVKSMSRSNLA